MMLQAVLGHINTDHNKKMLLKSGSSNIRGIFLKEYRFNSPNVYCLQYSKLDSTIYNYIQLKVTGTIIAEPHKL